MQHYSPKTLLLHYAVGVKVTLLSLFVLVPVMALFAAGAYFLGQLGQNTVDFSAMLKLMMIGLVLYACLIPLVYSYTKYFTTYYDVEADRLLTQTGLIFHKRIDYPYKGVTSMSLDVNQTNILGLCRLSISIKGQEDTLMYVDHLTVEAAQSIRNNYLESTKPDGLL